MEILELYKTIQDEDEELSPRKHLADLRNPFELYTCDEFTKRFRFTKNAVIHLLSIIKDDEEVQGRSHSLPAMFQLLCTLRFFATGDFQQAGDIAGITRCTAQRSIHKVSRAICRKKRLFIAFPADLNKVRNQFYDIGQFPNIVGVVDCTDVPIFSPGGEDSVYKNERGSFALKVQVICDAKEIITNVVARWPGSSSKVQIFQKSVIRGRFERASIDGYLLGSAAYNNEPYILTPFSIATTPSEIKYSQAHCQTYACIERCFRTLKGRFRALAVPLKTRLDNTMTIVVAVACLHNHAIRTKQPLTDFGNDLENEVSYETPSSLLSNHTTRENVIEKYFTDQMGDTDMTTS